MAYYPMLMQPFHQVIKALGKGSTNTLKNQLSPYTVAIEEHFLLWLRQSDTCIDLLLSELTDYIACHDLTDAPIALGERGVAQQMRYVFEHYVNQRIEPDDQLGLCLLETYLNGIEYITNLVDSFEQLSTGERLQVIHEKQNPFDDKALLICSHSGDRLGYIPRKHNAIPAFLSEQGKTLFAILKRKTWDVSGHHLKVLLYVETP
jgi:hypothetical protein